MHARGAVLCAIAACGPSPARTQLVNTTPNDCGKVPNASSVTVTALTAHGEVPRSVSADDPSTISDFPADTLQLEVQVLDAAGAVGVEGKTAPLAFNTLADGTELDVFLAPENGFCPTGDMLVARTRPLIARAGDGVLVAGGTDGTAQLKSAEYYDPATARWADVRVDGLSLDDNGFAGGVLTTLPGGNVVLTGTNRGFLAVFDATTHAFGDAKTIDPRVFHGAAAIDDNTVLVTGGCTEVASATCGGTPVIALHSTQEIPVDEPGNRVGGPSLPSGSRFGATLYDVGDGFVLAGGFGDPGEGDRFALGDATATTITGLTGSVAALDGGALIASDPTSTTTSVLPAGATVAESVLVSDAAAGDLVRLEDGTVLAVALASVQRYTPTIDRWALLDVPDASTCPLAGAETLLLGDGSVLVLGSSPPSTHACVFRPPLLGPTSGGANLMAPGVGNAVLTASDPSTFAVTPDAFELTPIDGSLAARFLIGGPRLVTGTLFAQVTIKPSGGIALIAQQVAPGQALVAQLGPSGSTLGRLGDAMMCSGPAVTPGNGVHVQLSIASDGTATVREDTTTLISCHVDVGTTPGAWGLAALGVNIPLDVSSVAVSR